MGSVNILRKEVLNQLKSGIDYQVVYYFMFTDGYNTYPKDEIDSFGSELKANKAVWTDKAGGSKLRPVIITDCPNKANPTLMQTKLNKFAMKIWGKADFCGLQTSVDASELGTTIIEQFKL